jgi:imidazolonepropionase
MSSTVVTGIGELVTCDGSTPDGLGLRHDAAVVVEDGHVAWVGSAADSPLTDRRVDVEGRAVLPGFVDSHSHLVFAGDRGDEFAARMAGAVYDGGGIDVSVVATRSATDDELRALVGARVAEMRAQGTTTIEIKSGYGLTIEDEARALRIAREFTSETTFLGAHVVPREYAGDRAAYLELVTGSMLTAAAPHARWIDVFCEPHSAHAFTEDEARTVLLAGREAGLDLRVHGNQLGHGPGVQLAVELGAASVDHCTYLSYEDIGALSGAADTTVATLLPGVEFSTRSPYPDAAALLRAGVSIALATDCNPGTCYSSSMPFVIALAVREMGLTPAQAVLAATVGSAKALRRNDIGQIAVGSRADLTLLEAPSYVHLSYRAGVPIARALDLGTA